MEREEVLALKQPKDNLCEFSNSSIYQCQGREISLIFLVVQVSPEGRREVSGMGDDLYQE